MKSEKNVQVRKTRNEEKLGDPLGETGKNVMFGGGLRGTGGKVAPFRHLVSPKGQDEKEEADIPGNREWPANPGEAG